MAKSGSPSALKSATVIAIGPVTLSGKRNGEPVTCVNVPSPFPLKTEYVLSLKLVTTNPGLPSPLFVLNVPVAIALGCPPTAIGLAIRLNVPSPFPVRTDTVFATGSVTTRPGNEFVFALILAVASAGGTTGFAVRAAPSEIG